jgi:hypothetical protein
MKEKFSRRMEPRTTYNRGKESGAMDLELATTCDIVNELHRRGMRFVFVGVENTNSSRKDLACLAGQGSSPHDVLDLIEMGQQAFARLDDDWSDGAAEE